MSVRRAAAIAAVAVIAPLTVVAGTAQAATAPTPRVTTHVSTSNPSSGQTFYVNGVFTIGGKAAADKVVKIQSLDSGKWVPLTGAHIDTTSTGTYKLRLILDRVGVRDLRAVGVVPGPAKDAFHRFTVTVH